MYPVLGSRQHIIVTDLEPVSVTGRCKSFFVSIGKTVIIKIGNKGKNLSLFWQGELLIWLQQQRSRWFTSEQSLAMMHCACNWVGNPIDIQKTYQYINIIGLASSSAKLSTVLNKSEHLYSDYCALYWTAAKLAAFYATYSFHWNLTPFVMHFEGGWAKKTWSMRIGSCVTSTHQLPPVEVMPKKWEMNLIGICSEKGLKPFCFLHGLSFFDRFRHKYLSVF